jgi:hypothetical protein
MKFILLRLETMEAAGSTGSVRLHEDNGIPIGLRVAYVKPCWTYVIFGMCILFKMEEK